MKDYRPLFALGSATWLDAAAQAPMSRAACAAAEEALRWRMEPASAPPDTSVEVPDALKRAAAELLCADMTDVGLGTSATYGLDLLSRSLQLQAGEDVLLFRGEFPTTVLPWLPLRRRGVSVRIAESMGPTVPVITPSVLKSALLPSTRVVCVSHVNSFSGAVAPLAELASVTRAHGAALVVNASQSVGVLPIDVRTLGIDALVTCSEKWLCGPHGAGLIWVAPSLRAKLELDQTHYAKAMRARGATSFVDYATSSVREPCGMDLAGYGHFIVHRAMTAAIGLVSEIGVNVISGHVLRLAARLRNALEPLGYGDLNVQHASPICSFSFGAPELNARAVEQLRADGIYVSLREGRVRVSPHLYNTTDDIDFFVERITAQSHARA